MIPQAAGPFTPDQKQHPSPPRTGRGSRGGATVVCSAFLSTPGRFAIPTDAPGRFAIPTDAPARFAIPTDAPARFAITTDAANERSD